MKTRIQRLATLLSISAVSIGSVALAHENDPKRNPEPPVYGDILYGDRDGIAGGWAGSQENTIFCAQVPINQLGGSGSGSDCWGYTSPSGREYAIIGMESAIAWVDVSDPFAPEVVYTYQRGGTSSLWCDVKVIGNYAYAVGESGGSIKIFNMSAIDKGVVSYLGESSANGNSATHNIAAVPEANLLIKCGGTGEGLRFYSTAGNPESPAFIGEWNDRYVHDADLVVYPQNGPDLLYRGRVIGFLNDGNNGGGSNTGLSIVDFSILACNSMARAISTMRRTLGSAGFSACVSHYHGFRTHHMYHISTYMYYMSKYVTICTTYFLKSGTFFMTYVSGTCYIYGTLHIYIICTTF